MIKFVSKIRRKKKLKQLIEGHSIQQYILAKSIRHLKFMIMVKKDTKNFYSKSSSDYHTLTDEISEYEKKLLYKKIHLEKLSTIKIKAENEYDSIKFIWNK